MDDDDGFGVTANDGVDPGTIHFCDVDGELISRVPLADLYAQMPHFGIGVAVSQQAMLGLILMSPDSSAVARLAPTDFVVLLEAPGQTRH